MQKLRIKCYTVIVVVLTSFVEYAESSVENMDLAWRSAARRMERLPNNTHHNNCIFYYFSIKMWTFSFHYLSLFIECN
jgi:hypothetical protein